MFAAEDYPGLFQAADAAATAAQRIYLRAYALRLWLALFAATCAAFTIRIGSARTDIAALGTALGFVSILAIDVALLSTRPSRTWHEGRALAESVKSLAWKYSVGGTPFDSNRADPDTRLLDRIRALQRAVPDLTVRPTTASCITGRMRDLRRCTFPERRRIYLEHRIHEQQEWYASRSASHHRRGNRLYALGLFLEIGGITAALGKAFNTIDFDLAGIVAAAIAALAAWSSARQHIRTAITYATTSNELAIITDALTNASENDWATAVARAEEAINREHALWRAAHHE
ncbi:DUF4231 domain-containing protein [Nocardia huaxiensis]|uniref:DUF4231 domain-containing protein n=1 Tax=Nocardia huaxiensis TaxID=2755382 RepID=A0A7D6ZSG1_9NOCA|nr:DUF4231 domain-containing protein [Nocardia huaxiensis]QLY32785.1 DUF4231 domain-containing protein [Nocardia huaxiensis]UFS93477.1 DUF4231 domain-containing protein [Nocardia huaxiensis]